MPMGDCWVPAGRPTCTRSTRRGCCAAELARLLRLLHAVPARDSADPGARVLHLDLHPDNVILTPDGPRVIDWSNAEDGPPGLDWGTSAVILAQVAVGDDALAARPARCSPPCSPIRPTSRRRGSRRRGSRRRGGGARTIRR
ncbi:phosphotransferase family protein [Streptomyces sp. NPDC001480]|uniref:phosphotransferase family protein n=1 Tax=Streptomyces sp. NPDC001480 TaxID=3364577 RepID=UPI00368FE131